MICDICKGTGYLRDIDGNWSKCSCLMGVKRQ